MVIILVCIVEIQLTKLFHIACNTATIVVYQLSTILNLFILMLNSLIIRIFGCPGLLFTKTMYHWGEFQNNFKLLPERESSL